MKHTARVKALSLPSLLLALLPLASPAQDSLAQVKKLYADTAAAIELGRKGEGGGLYSNEVQLNSRGLPWRAVGNYSKKIVFWYSDQPEFAAYENKSEASVLAKVEVKTTAAVRSEYEEFLFQDGALVFFFRQSQAGAEPREEERYYLHNNALLKAFKGNQAVADQPDPASILKRASAYQQLFLAMFQ